MHKDEFYKSLAESENIMDIEAHRISTIVFNQIRRSILQGEEVRIVGVGKFSFLFKDARDKINNFTGERIHVPPSVSLKFKTFPTMREELQELADE